MSDQNQPHQPPASEPKGKEHKYGYEGIAMPQAKKGYQPEDGKPSIDQNNPPVGGWVGGQHNQSSEASQDDGVSSSKE